MILVAWRDLQFRRLRFLVSVLAVALVFALSLILTGVSMSFDTEIDRSLAQLGGDTYAFSQDASGPFFGAAPLAESVAADVADVPGVRRAAPIAFRPMTIDSPRRRQANVFGIVGDGLGTPPIVEGSLPSDPGDAVIDRRADLGVGDRFTVAGKQFLVTGLTEDSTLLAGSPNAFIGLDDFQSIAFGDQPIITTVLVEGHPESLPAGLQLGDRAAAHVDLKEPIKAAGDTIYLIMGLLWLVAAAIVGSVIYLSASERMNEFAVFKAIGVSTAAVVRGLVVQSAILSSVAIAAAVMMGFLLAPIFPIPVEIPPVAIALVVAVGMVIGLLTSIVAVRKATSVDPALAFG